VDWTELAQVLIWRHSVGNILPKLGVIQIIGHLLGS
jgi:hypothetical protein